MKKNIYILLSLLLTISCSTDDSSDSANETIFGQWKITQSITWKPDNTSKSDTINLIDQNYILTINTDSTLTMNPTYNSIYFDNYYYNNSFIYSENDKYYIKKGNIVHHEIRMIYTDNTLSIAHIVLNPFQHDYHSLHSFEKINN